MHLETTSKVQCNTTKNPENMDCPQKVRHFLGAFFMYRKEKFSVAFKLECI
ncbi:hypothetical protein SAMN05444360_1131, partial [Chryseobacterium carnipullorum]